MDRRSLLMMSGFAALAAAVPIATLTANAAPRDANTGPYLFQDEFDRPGGCDPALGNFPAAMLVDWIRVW